MPRGGRRTGKPGQLYQNRSDLRQPQTQPVQTATGQTYGQAQAQAQAQKVVPLPTQALPGPTGGPSPPAPPPPAGPVPGTLPTLAGPSLKPNEPVTAGAALGAGPGPEVLNVAPDTTATLLNQLASQPGAPSAVTRLAQYVNAGRR